MPLKRVLLFSRHVKAAYVKPYMELKSILVNKGIEVCVTADLYDFVAKRDSVNDVTRISGQQELGDADVDTVITLGGDGTILGATALIGPLEIPILGINLGRLGFLAGVEKHLLHQAIDEIIEGKHTISERTMVTLIDDLGIFQGVNYGLNDITVHKRDTSSMITIHTFINGEHLNSYWADGLIMATPTGSTGYSLSCGGPIIFPGSENFVLTPVAPHNLNIRPLVIPDSSEVSFQVEGRTKRFLCSLDSRIATITSKQKLIVKKCNFNTHLIMLSGQSFLNTIHEKLSWGSDHRNK